MANKLKTYLADPFLNRLYRDLRKAGAIKSISVDITHTCNIRCAGCYYFSEGMDQYKSPKDESIFDEFVAREKARGTNFVTIVGGEPSLVLQRASETAISTIRIFAPTMRIFRQHAAVAPVSTATAKPVLTPGSTSRG
jgi:organic radical activating enzyme